MSNNKYNVLFLCTGNSARSIMAEALLSRWGREHFNAFSAGSNPKGRVHPLTLKTLEKSNFNTEGYRSKSWEEFTCDDAPDIDFIITVCSNAAKETCPVIPGEPVSAHWDVEDPAADYETEEEQKHAFYRAFLELDERIQLFTCLPMEKIDKMALHEHLKKISN